MAAESAGRWASTRIQGDVDAVGGKKGPRGAQTEPEMPERYNGKYWVAIPLLGTQGAGLGRGLWEHQLRCGIERGGWWGEMPEITKGGCRAEGSRATEPPPCIGHRSHRGRLEEETLGERQRGKQSQGTGVTQANPGKCSGTEEAVQCCFHRSHEIPQWEVTNDQQTFAAAPPTLAPQGHRLQRGGGEGSHRLSVAEKLEDNMGSLWGARGQEVSACLCLSP